MRTSSGWPEDLPGRRSSCRSLSWSGSWFGSWSVGPVPSRGRAPGCGHRLESRRAHDPTHDPLLPVRLTRSDHPVSQTGFPPACQRYGEHPSRGRLHRGMQPFVGPGLLDGHALPGRRGRARVLTGQVHDLRCADPRARLQGRRPDPRLPGHERSRKLSGRGGEASACRGRHHDLPRGHALARPAPVAHGRQDGGGASGHAHRCAPAAHGAMGGAEHSGLLWRWISSAAPQGCAGCDW